MIRNHILKVNKSNVGHICLLLTNRFNVCDSLSVIENEHFHRPLPPTFSPWAWSSITSRRGENMHFQVTTWRKSTEKFNVVANKIYRLIQVWIIVVLLITSVWTAEKLSFHCQKMYLKSLHNKLYILRLIFGSFIWFLKSVN